MLEAIPLRAEDFLGNIQFMSGSVFLSEEGLSNFILEVLCCVVGTEMSSGPPVGYLRDGWYLGTDQPWRRCGPASEVPVV